LLSRVELEDPFMEAPYALAASSELGLTFVLHHGEDDAEIVALRSLREGLEVAWRQSAPEAAHFIQDIHGRRALLLSVDEGRLRVDTLETPLPAPHTPLSFANDRALPWTGPSFFECLLRERPGLADAAQAACSLPAVARGARIEDLRRAHDPDAEALLLLAQTLSRAGEQDRAEGIVEQAYQRHSSHPRIVLHRAEAAAREEDWGAVLTHLDGFDGQALGEERAHNVPKLRGLALFHIGRFDEALASFRKAMEEGGDPTRLIDWINLIDALTDERPLEEWEKPAPLVRRLVAAIRRADACLARGDIEGAHAVLDVWPVWQAEEAQSLGRLSHVVLERAPTDPVGCFHAGLVLACFLEQQGQLRESLTGNLPLGKWAWSDARLAELEERARAWMEAGANAGGPNRRQ
ncbi:MAG: hypothetical protein L0Y66_12545, partial [Myxococcaceae bacterium]|nr:hypothetical protein [Myxococcaceae bacterium]